MDSDRKQERKSPSFNLALESTQKRFRIVQEMAKGDHVEMVFGNLAHILKFEF
jgi:hypothetical protein